MPDKLLHVVVSFVLAQVDPALAVVAGFGKELWDLLGAGTAELGDLAADAAGIVLALILG